MAQPRWTGYRSSREVTVVTVFPAGTDADWWGQAGAAGMLIPGLVTAPHEVTGQPALHTVRWMFERTGWLRGVLVMPVLPDGRSGPRSLDSVLVLQSTVLTLGGRPAPLRLEGPYAQIVCDPTVIHVGSMAELTLEPREGYPRVIVALVYDELNPYRLATQAQERILAAARSDPSGQA